MSNRARTLSLTAPGLVQLLDKTLRRVYRLASVPKKQPGGRTREELVSDTDRDPVLRAFDVRIGRGDFLKLAGLSAGAAAFAAFAPECGSARAEQTGAPVAGWAKGIKIVFEAGGNPGDAFAQIVINGAQQAAQDLGCHLDILHAGWDSSTMVQQYRQTIATAPDGLAMMGHPGDAALMPIAQQAHAQGVLTEYVNVDLPQVRAAFGGGYVGADLYKEGKGLAMPPSRISRSSRGQSHRLRQLWHARHRAARSRHRGDA